MIEKRGTAQWCTGKRLEIQSIAAAACLWTNPTPLSQRAALAGAPSALGVSVALS